MQGTKTFAASAGSTNESGWLNALAATWPWQTLAWAGLATVFVGLGIDAWRHNGANAGEESLLSLSNPGHAVAAAGLAAAVAGVLMSTSLSAAGHVRASGRASVALPAAAAAWVITIAAAVGSLTYIAASGTTVGHSHTAAVPGRAAGSEESHVHAAGAHDHGPHATFSQVMTLPDAELMPRFPAGTVAAADVPLLRTQLRAAADAAARYPTTAAAEAAGYRLTTTDVDYMGLHYVSLDHVTDGVFDPARPEGLLFSRTVSAGPVLVGVWFLQAPGVGDVSRDVAPEGFAGALDYWHGHQNVCLPFETEGVTEEHCTAQGGRFVSDTRWMMHAWVVPADGDNPDGVFAYLNRALYAQQLAFNRGDPDSDGDGLRDSLELRFAHNPIASDSDSDGVSDGTDVDWLASAVMQLPEASLTSLDVDERPALLTLLDTAGKKIAAEDAAGAVAELQRLQERLGGCVLNAVAAQWMQACATQAEARELIDIFIANVRGRAT